MLYDRPSPAFKPIPVIEKHELFKKLAEEYPTFASMDTHTDPAVAESTVFTQKLQNGDVVLRPNRPALLISSTSWTPDEDFGILLRALESNVPLQWNFRCPFTDINFICRIRCYGKQFIELSETCVRHHGEGTAKGAVPGAHFQKYLDQSLHSNAMAGE